MTTNESNGMRVVFTPATGGAAWGKVADAEVWFESGLLAGLKLCGFGLWTARGGAGINLTFPARSYTVNGARRSFALLRPSRDVSGARYADSLKAHILAAWTAECDGRAAAERPAAQTPAMLASFDAYAKAHPIADVTVSTAPASSAALAEVLSRM